MFRFFQEGERGDLAQARAVARTQGAGGRISGAGTRRRGEVDCVLLLVRFPEIRGRYLVDLLQAREGAEHLGVPLGPEVEAELLER